MVHMCLYVCVSVCVCIPLVYLERFIIEGAENEGVGSSVVMQWTCASFVVLSIKLSVSVSSTTEFISSWHRSR